MRRKLVFAASLAGVSLALFAVWPWIVPVLRLPAVPLLAALRALLGSGVAAVSEDQSHFIIPALAAILVARGVPILRRAVFASSAAVLFSLLEPLARCLNVAVFTRTGGVLTELSLLAYFTMTFAFSAAVIVVFLDGRPETLWEPALVPAERTPPCPLCGKRKANLTAHVRDAHGEKMLRDRRVRRALGA